MYCIQIRLYTQLLRLIVLLYLVDMVDALDSLAVGHPHQESAFSWLDGQTKPLGACARQGCQKVLLGQLLVLSDFFSAQGSGDESPSDTR